jgi:tRNA A-37 threonylcarbamoyl transferase component Bud32
MKILKELKGHSNSQILLVEDQGQTFVRKNFDIARNLERYQSLSLIDVRIPKVFNVNIDSYDMEYIPHVDIKHFLAAHNTVEISMFIISLIDKLEIGSVDKDYTQTYKDKLSKFDFEKYRMPFTSDELLNRLPKMLPQSNYHGDLTLENILYDSQQNNFVLIDPITTEYDSYIFDLAKLRQDLVCKWFIRNDQYYFDSKLKIILESLSQFKYYNDSSLLILMLMRVIPYTNKIEDEEFLLNEVRKLWK